MPSLTFSPPSFSSTASSRTMFRKTYKVCVSNRNGGVINLVLFAYIVSAQNANNLTATVQLDKQTLVEVLEFQR